MSAFSGICTCKHDLNNKHNFKELSGSDSMPQLFLPGIVNTSLFEMNSMFSVSGNEFYYSIADPYQNYNTIVFVAKENEAWGKAEIVSFSGMYSDFDPFINYEGTKLYFCSRRPLKYSDNNRGDANIWYVEKNKKDWSNPKALGNEINSEYDEYYISISKKGTKYFSSTKPEGIGAWDIYFAIEHNSESRVYNIGEPVNSKYREWDPFISADEDFIIFTSDRPGGFGGGDLYISYKQSKGEWGNPINLGEKINTTDYEFCPFVSRNKEYLYFSRFGGSTESLITDSKKSMLELQEKLNSTDNGLGNIYRIRIKELEAYIK